MLRALIVPASSGEWEDGGGRLPDECAVLIWSCLTLAEQMRISGLSVAGRHGAPPVVHLAVVANRLSQALASPTAGTDVREMRALTELAGNSRESLRFHFPACVSFVCGLMRSPKTCTNTRQCAVGCAGWLLGNPRRLCEVFAEYDCNVDQPAVLESALESLAWATSHDSLRCHAVRVLVGIARAVAAGVAAAMPVSAGGMTDNPASASQLGPWATAWAEQQRLGSEAKGQINAFNCEPEVWWRACNDANCDADHAARFLFRNRSAMDEQKLGHFLGQHGDVLEAYLRHFDLKGLAIVPAFSRVLQGMQLPGEAQQIDRFCERFGTAWGQANKINSEAAYIFAFSLIMLSTDLHRTTCRSQGHMTLAQFEKSLRGALPRKSRVKNKMIRDAYTAIKIDPLWARRQGDGEESPREICKRLRQALHRSQPWAKQQRLGQSPVGMQDLWRALWSACWGPLLGAFSAGAHGAGKDATLHEMGLRGLQLCCQVATMLQEVEQAQAFGTALQQLSGSHCC
mmetsp:Transcript_22845/g.44414  ORF Transcript_22845/g.44414 Transcript_22845/m.44414 type:complete len:514 (-) Transcript_22845:363-1904(-)